MCSSEIPDRRHNRERVHRGAERAERLEELDALALVPEHDGLDDREAAAPQRLRDLRDRRELEDPADRGHLVRHGRRPGVPRVQHLR